MKDVLPSSGGSTEAGILPWLGTKHEKITWGAEFISTSFTVKDLFEGTNETAFLHDFTLTYLLPSPVQLERREVDF